MTEQGIVRESLIQVFKKNGYLELNHLTQRDFDHISSEIEVGTGTLISSSTIKRLLNGKFSRLPQVATLDAISKYLGYRSWQEYRSALVHRDGVLPGEDKKQKPEIIVQKKASTEFKRIKIAAIVCLSIGILVIAGFIQLSEKRRFPDFSKASFAARKNTTNEIPNTVVFNYNVDQIKADSFFIQQSWDRNRRVRIFKKNYVLTDIYYEPGYHIAKLIANDSVIRIVEISIPTDRWFLYAKDNPRSIPEYINAPGSATDGIFSVTEKDVLDSKIDASKEKEYVYAYFPGKLEVSSDNYVLRTKVRVNEIKKNFCPYLMLEVFSQRYSMFFKCTPRGCSSEAMLQFGDQFVSGKESDLAFLGFDVTQWMDVELSVKDRHVKIFINNKEVFSTSYKHTSKLITGLAFISNGLCQVDFIEMKGLDGRIVYENDFNSKGN
jgi:hypothetical protein